MDYPNSLPRNMLNIYLTGPVCEVLMPDTLPWRVHSVSSVKEAFKSLKTNHCTVGLLQIANLKPDQLAELEDFCISYPDVFWVALADTQQLFDQQIARFISTYCCDFFRLPMQSINLLEFTLEHANGMAYMHKRQQLIPSNYEHEMVGSAPEMFRVFEMIRKTASVDAALLITGESGTGKEMIANAVHERSARKKGPFIAVNCGAIPANLIQSELFGHEKGAFTGAAQRQIGKIEQADGGTLFLDEIGDLPLEMQVNLLRFLQEGTIERIGSQQTIKPSVRVIAATHVDLPQAIAAQNFREDLYYRLNVLNIHSPALRDRIEDVPLLAQYFFRRFQHESPIKLKGFTHCALQRLRQHDWPGNVRELINRVRRAIIMCDNQYIKAQDLGFSDTPRANQIETLEACRQSAEHQAIINSLHANPNNMTQAAAELGISRTTLYRLLHKHNIQPPENGAA